MPCDPFQMILIHRAFRAEIGNLPALITAVAPGDIKRAKLVGSYLGNMILVLQAHHDAEDRLLWPKLVSRMRGDNSDVERAESEHARVAGIVSRVQMDRPAWMRSANPALGEKLSGAVEDLSTALNEHTAEEERTVVPLITAHISHWEWDHFIDHGAAYVNPRNLWFALAYAGVMLRDGTSVERARFAASIPVPLRIVLKLLGGHAYASYQRRLYGAQCSRR